MGHLSMQGVGIFDRVETLDQRAVGASSLRAMSVSAVVARQDDVRQFVQQRVPADPDFAGDRSTLGIRIPNVPGLRGGAFPAGERRELTVIGYVGHG